jgi:GSCFA family
MMMHPYEKLPASSHWRRACQDVAPEAIDPVGNFKFRIQQSDKVATAGSCFAQHIARHLNKSGFHHYVTEAGHPIGAPHIRQKFNYGMFSARYGNIYTSRQLLQLFERAFGDFSPVDDCWRNTEGMYVDPYRPTIQPGGFSSHEECIADRQQHLASVRHMFQTLDFFVFTLGLTEHWKSAIDDAVFPVCPGVAGGSFDSERYQFHNLSVEEVVSDMRSFRAGLHRINKNAKIILTVSPVPLMATMEPRHVLVSTMASKAILRVAADQLERDFDNIAYFPSYEIITSQFSEGKYFGPDFRSITEEGVEHVMRLFLLHATDNAMRDALPVVASATSHTDTVVSENFAQNAKTIVNVLCDEDLM